MTPFSTSAAGRSRLKPKAKRVKRHVTIREVAKAAGASVSTISAALNNSDYVSAKMRSRIEEAAKALRYCPNDLARGLRLQKTHSIAIVVPDLSNNFYIELVRGAKDYSASANFTVLIGDSRENWEEERNYFGFISPAPRRRCCASARHKCRRRKSQIGSGKSSRGLRGPSSACA